MRPITIRIKKRKLRAIKLIVCGCLIFFVLSSIDKRVRPIIQTIASYQAQLLATRAINDAVMEVIAEEDVVYNSIIEISKGTDGEVTSISTDMITMNRLKAKITNKVADELLDDPENTLYIPIGTLLGGELFSGRGPMIAFKVLPAGSVHTEIYNDFQQAGINQTLHQIMLTVETDVSAVMPIYTIQTNVDTNICIAETIIVGKVPSAYTDINGDMSTLLDQINDYGQGELPNTPAS